MKKIMMLKLLNLVDKVDKRQDEEYERFLEFYQTLVVAATPRASRAFGRMSVDTISKAGSIAKAGIELTPVDLLYWRTAILEGGTRFRYGIPHVKQEIYNKLCNSAESHDMNEEERAEFIRLMRSEEP